MPKSKDPDLAAPPGDILMAIVENRYRGKYPCAPRTPYLLIVQALNEERAILMIRVLGISGHARKSLEREGAAWVETDAYVESHLNEYFSIDWTRHQGGFCQGTAARPVSAMVH